MLARHKNRGFSLVELMITLTLSILLLLMVSGLWGVLGRSLVENMSDARLAAEANFGLESLRRDFSGYRPGGTTGSKEESQLIGRMLVGSSKLRLCFEGTPINGSADWASPDYVVEYELVNNQVLRTDLAAENVFVVANHAEEFEVTDLGTGVRVELTLKHRDVEKTYTLIKQD